MARTTTHATLKPAGLYHKASTTSLYSTLVIQESRTIRMMHIKAGYNAGKVSAPYSQSVESPMLHHQAGAKPEAFYVYH